MSIVANSTAPKTTMMQAANDSGLQQQALDNPAAMLNNKTSGVRKLVSTYAVSNKKKLSAENADQRAQIGQPFGQKRNSTNQYMQKQAANNQQSSEAMQQYSGQQQASFQASRNGMVGLHTGQNVQNTGLSLGGVHEPTALGNEVKYQI